MKKSKRIVIAALAIAVMIGISVIPFASGSQSDEQMPAQRGAAEIKEKSEAIYARLSESGEAQSIYVVNHFVLEKCGAFNDFGNYTSVINLTDLEPLTIANGEVTAETDCENYFYQGNLADKNLPWLYSVEFFLDGEKITPEDLAGGAGSLIIRVVSYKNTAINEVFYENYMQQITVTLNIDKCRNITASGAINSNAGKNRILTYTIMPGNDADITIKADVNDFEMSGIEIAAMPFTMDIEIKGTEDMLDDFSKLADAITDLNDGVDKLFEGAAEMKEGADGLKNSSSEINDGLSQLNSNSEQLTEASTQIQSALQQIAAGLDSSGDTGQVSIMAELALLPDGLIQIADGMAQVSDGMQQLLSGYAQAYAALDDAISAIPDQNISEEQILSLFARVGESEEAVILNNLVDSYVAAMTVKGTYEQAGAALASVTFSLEALSSSVDTMEAALRDTVEQINTALSGDDTIDQLQQLTDGISVLAEGFDEFHQGLIAYAEAIGELADGYGEFNSGVESFSGGMTELYNGIEALYDGCAQMVDETSDMPDLIKNELDSIVNEYTSSEFSAMSFTSGKNNKISYVQFVFITEGIAKPESDPASAAAENQQTFWERLIRLFF